MELEQNKEAVKLFGDKLNQVKPKSCIVKSGWRSGDNIDFLLAFEKGGDKNPFDLFIANIPDIIESYGFICGLHPEIFHFNPKFAIENETHFFIDFKLKRNE